MAERQKNLFAAEDWKIAYKAYSKVDFQAYDFDSIRKALVEYVKTNYPENFNDYIESSEFIAIIEMLAFLSQSLAFRMDVNTRENFLETAERRDSVFKLAKMLGYNPKRNLPAAGLMKIVSVKTTESLKDSLGNDLNNRNIFWDDNNNPQSYEQFITVLNSAMSKSNRFTSPIKTGTVGDIPIELYQLNTPVATPIVQKFELSINGSNKVFNVVNPDFVDSSHFYERAPDPTNLFNLIYRNDSKGLSSQDTGFFVYFRQGNLQFQDFNYTAARENRFEDIAVENINESDVYLQEVATTGQVLQQWSKVPNTVGQTLNYNSISLGTKNLYSVENLGTGGIRLRFSDGNFGNIPTGVYRLWYRTSDPTRYTITPADGKNKSINIPYVNAKGESHTLTLRFSLQRAVSNSFPAESVAAIKERAPKIFYTQNRMVSAQDYNVFPQSQSSNITKVKALNRTHAGHSRYIDINDPTGTFHNVDTFANDAYLYLEDRTVSENVIVNNNTTPLEVVTSIIFNKLKSQHINNFSYYGMRNAYTDPSIGGNPDYFSFKLEDTVTWNTQPAKPTGNRGFITEEFEGTRNVLLNNTPQTRMLTENSFVKFVNPNNISEYKWTRIISVENNGLLTAGVTSGNGPWSLADEVPTLWRLTEVIVSLRKQFNTTEIDAITQLITDKKSFGLGYDLIKDSWYIIEGSNITNIVRNGKFYIDSANRGAYSWLILMDYEPIDAYSYKYTLTLRGQDYVVHSKSDIRFYNVKDIKVVDSSNKSSKDTIVFTTVNAKPGETETFQWNIATKQWYNTTTGTYHRPEAFKVELPLRSRDTYFYDVDTAWVSNFGILQKENGNISATASKDLFVKDAVVPLKTYHQVGAITSETNIVIGNNIGQITSVPSHINVAFTSSTFGSEIVDETVTPNAIYYKQIPDDGGAGDELIFRANVGQTPHSYGVDGTSPDDSISGRLKLISYDPTTKTGVLQYNKVQHHDLVDMKDKSGYTSKDKINVKYKTSKDKLDAPIKWEISDIYRESDGYTNPAKIKVSPVDTDNDGVPDKPRQFAEYVGETQLVLFEYYTDFDGYKYDRPFEGVVLDYRNETSLTVNDAEDTISPGSYTDKTKLSLVNWILVKDSVVARSLENIDNAQDIIIYVASTNTVYKLERLSTTDISGGYEIRLQPTEDYFVKVGRGKSQNTLDINQQDSTIKWSHVAPNDVRIDPSISNVVEMIVLTTSYYSDVQKWLANPLNDFPLEPTTYELSTEFSGLNTYKSASDSLVFRSAKFRLLFGNNAEAENQARFRVVRLSDQVSDNELKTQIISAINDYFNVANWEFGETFYFTELSTYIHQRLGTAIGSIVILPKNLRGQLGELFQVKAEANELFLSTAKVTDIDIVSRLDNQTLRVDR